MRCECIGTKVILELDIEEALELTDYLRPDDIGKKDFPVIYHIATKLRELAEEL